MNITNEENVNKEVSHQLDLISWCEYQNIVNFFRFKLQTKIWKKKEKNSTIFFINNE